MDAESTSIACRRGVCFLVFFLSLPASVTFLQPALAGSYMEVVQSCHSGHHDYRKAMRLVRADPGVFPQLQSAEALNSLLTEIKDDTLRTCPAPDMIGIGIDIMAPSPWDNISNSINFSSVIIYADWDRATNQFSISYNEVEKVLSKYNAYVAEQQAIKQKAKAIDEQRKREQQALEIKTQAALSDCGQSPTLSGGPWFSSTYKVGAIDEAKRVGMLCVKSIEYVGPAVNPMGGNAARAKFFGYDRQTASPIVFQRDFPY